MPRSKLAKTLTLRVELTTRLEAFWRRSMKKKPATTSENLGGFLNDYLGVMLEKEEFIDRMFPFFSVLSVSDNMIFIRDSHTNQIVEVSFHYDVHKKENRLFCGVDRGFSCSHINYSLATLDVARLTQPIGGSVRQQQGQGQQTQQPIQQQRHHHQHNTDN